MRSVGLFGLVLLVLFASGPSHAQGARSSGAADTAKAKAADGGAVARLGSWVDRLHYETTPPEKKPPAVVRTWLIDALEKALGSRGNAGSRADIDRRAEVTVDSLLKAVASVDDERTAWSGTVKVGLQSDQAPGKTHFEIPSGVSIKKGAYPNELRFTAETDFTTDNSKTTEDVTTLLANFDHHLSALVELYAFVERFSDNFMAIEGRYEAGLGTRFGKWIGRARLKPQWVQSGIREFPTAQLRAIAEGQDRGAAGEGFIPDEVRDFFGHLEVDQTAIDEMSRPLFLGVAFSAFQELEQAQSTVKDTTKVEPVTIRPPSEHQIRWVIRPSAEWRPTPALSLASMWYFKFGEATRGDIRVDASVTASLSLDAEPGLKNVAIVAEYKLRRDTMPPRVSALELAKSGIKIAGDEFRAPDRHESLHLGIQVGL